MKILSLCLLATSAALIAPASLAAPASDWAKLGKEEATRHLARGVIGYAACGFGEHFDAAQTFQDTYSLDILEIQQTDTYAQATSAAAKEINTTEGAARIAKCEQLDAQYGDNGSVFKGYYTRKGEYSVLEPTGDADAEESDAD